MIAMTAQKIVTESLKKYELPPLPYAPDALEPHISKEQLSLHHDKHHQAYVTGRMRTLRDWRRRDRKEPTSI